MPEGEKLIQCDFKVRNFAMSCRCKPGTTWSSCPSMCEKASIHPSRLPPSPLWAVYPRSLPGWTSSWILLRTSINRRSKWEVVVRLGISSPSCLLAGTPQAGCSPHRWTQLLRRPSSHSLSASKFWEGSSLLSGLQVQRAGRNSFPHCY